MSPETMNLDAPGDSQRQVLLLAEQYYPLQVPSTFRIHSFAKYLPEFGFSCRVVAPAWNETNLEHASHARQVFPGSESESPCPLTQVPVHPVFTASRLSSYLRPFREGAAIAQEMIQASSELHRTNPFRAIVATAPAYYPVRAGLALAEQWQVPLVVDLRDVYGEHEGAWRRGWLGQLSHLAKGLAGKRAIACRELTRMCNQADATTTVSQPLVELLKQRGVHRVDVILNGFDPDDFPEDVPVDSTRFRLTYAGTVHPFQDPNPLWDALDRLLQRQQLDPDRVEVAFYTRPGSIAPRVQGRPCQAIVREYAQVPKREITRRLMESSILLHLSAVTHSGGIFTSKIAEYLGAGRPIVTMTGDGDVVDAFLRETRSGVSLAQPEEIATYLLDQYHHWQQTGKPRYDAITEKRESYTRRSQCQVLSGILNELTLPR